MKRVAFALLLVLFLSGLTLAPLTIAGPEGPSANGSYKVSIENGHSRDIQFNARVASDGRATGEITFRDDGPVSSASKASGESEASEPLPPFYAKASCDCLLVNGVEAALSGTIVESNYKHFIGRRVMLVVQDGDSLTPPLRDKLTWGFYRTKTKSWIATDSERPEEGPPPTWVATDAEREDDPGVLSQKREEVTCDSLPISSYSFIGAKQGKGKIQVSR